MPYMNVKTTAAIDAGKRETIKSELGKAIELIPGKSENWLMVSFEDNSIMYFKGSSERPLAYIEVKIFGKSSKDAYENLTKAITGIIHKELSIDPDCVYVIYEEISNWGWNGTNF
ncbi:phenylpyruvate tautomerase MIF-related protein [Anaerobium acetethylicum]|uniref:L-dopachrome isomerase n=1 Tax=Anaerobium acetethylicum TaxID=1619234 RepID=A0A1D3TPI7_9FIRM|nr:phenylpyruvate tautomerase MIF-related protein [Anaerobium acetethylicum]SCP95277.1 Phenylpyruvate tautomerase PptA, 4-oxalocrotonate tautomerase family [Anaerobium acetethylicum]